MEEQQAKEIANFRYRLIAPIVSRDNLLPGELKALIEEAASKTYLIPYSKRSKVSTRSIERYLAEYRRGGFLALMPGRRTGRRSQVPQKYLDQVLCRRIVGGLQFSRIEAEFHQRILSVKKYSKRNLNEYLYKSDI